MSDANQPREDAVISPVAGEAMLAVPPIEALLRPDEHVIDERTGVISEVGEDGHASHARAGRLYLTDRRLIHVGGEVSSIELADITELGVATRRVFITLSGARGVIVDVARPARLRSSLALAVGALRARSVA